MSDREWSLGAFEALSLRVELKVAKARRLKGQRDVKGLLKDILVLDLADEQGSFCSKLLADLGATVIKVEGPGGDPSRLQNPASFFYNNANKLGISVNVGYHGRETLKRLVKRSDVLVETAQPRVLESLGLGPQRLRRLNPRLIHLSITPFGRTGPRCTYRSSDSVLSAFGGQMYVSGTQSGPPVKLCGSQPYYAASLFGAVAVLLHLRKRNISGKGSYFDLSIQEAVASTLGHVMIDYFHSGRISRRGENDKSEGFSILPAKDGYIQITILRNWDTLLELIDSEGLAGDLLDNKWLDASYREEHFDHIASIVAEWTRRHTKRELFELGQTMRFPWASIDTIDEVLTSPQLKFRKFFNQRPFSGEGPEITFPGPPYKFSSLSPLSQKPAPFPAKDASDILDALLSEREKKETEPEIQNRCADEKILQGLRVLDLTRMLSGPYATRILADYGAEVIKVQSGKTAQGAEQNETAYFSAWNRNKRSITLDLNAPEAKDAFLKLAAGSDVIMENFSPRVMENWELGYERLREVNPELVMISISAMGRTGPWRDFVGFAPTFHALSGLISETSENLNPPADLGHAYGDVIAGLYAALATLAAIEYRQKTGKGRHVDLSVYEAMCTLLGPAFIEKQIDSKFEIRDSRFEKNHQFDGQSRISNFESRIYKCAGLDRWCVISLETEEQRQTLCGIAGLGELTDDLIRRWTALQTPESIVLQLQNAGIAAGVVQNAEDLARDPQLAARRFFVSLKHPTLGKVISDRSALWDWRHRPKNWKPSPLLGQDNPTYLEPSSL